MRMTNRTTPWDTLRRRGKDNARVTLTEMPLDSTPAILGEFARKVPGGRSFLTVAADASDAEFAEASSHHPVFRLD